MGSGDARGNIEKSFTVIDFQELISKKSLFWITVNDFKKMLGDNDALRGDLRGRGRRFEGQFAQRGA